LFENNTIIKNNISDNKRKIVIMYTSETDLSRIIDNYNDRIYKEYNKKDLVFFKMRNDDNGLKFKSGRMYTSDRRYFDTVEDIIKLCKKYPNKFNSDKIPNFGEESYKELIEKCYQRIYPNSLSKLHIDVIEMYSLLENIVNDSDDGKIIDMNDTISEMIEGVSTSKVGAAFCKHLLDEGYNTFFKNDKLNENEFNIYKEALKLSIVCTMKSDLVMSDSEYSRDIENFINDNLVNNNNNIKNNLENVFEKIPDLKKNPFVNAFLYRIESTEHYRDDGECISLMSNNDTNSILKNDTLKYDRVKDIL